MTVPTRRPLSIINADDFGLSSEMNQTILAAFEQGLISSATVMANMPAFAQACELTHQHGLQDRIGLHFNLTHGEPLSEAIRDRREFCDGDGRFDLDLPRYYPRLPTAAAHAVQTELAAQWARCEQHGIRPSHIDSHQHVHNLWPIAAIVARFARAQRVPVRLARNQGRNIGLLKLLYKSLLNRRLTRLSGAAACFACTPRDLLDGIRPAGPVEIVAHPVTLADGRIGDDYLPSDVSLQDVLRLALDGYQQVGYRALVQPQQIRPHAIQPCPSEPNFAASASTNARTRDSI